MLIDVAKLSKRFQREWIFRELSISLRSGDAYAVTGPNGSGKSTLLQVLSGIMPATSGKITYRTGDTEIEPGHIYRYLSYASPYLELVEELTLAEHIDFHYRFKKPVSGMDKKEFAEQAGLQDTLHKQIRYFSSGMKQRLRLAFAFFTDDPFLILDEPTSNLDSKGVDWYLRQIEKLHPDRLVLVGSNQPYEYEFCKNVINLTDFKLRG
jgi:ABC-type multidrug transport system ATPase subunit